jgi:hypothetical protein
LAKAENRLKKEDLKKVGRHGRKSSNAEKGR